MKSFLLWIGVFTFLLTTCLAYREVAKKKKPSLKDLMKLKPDLVGVEKHPSRAHKVKSYQKFVKCQSRDDCSPKQCCAGVSSTMNGTCLHQPQLKEVCFPQMLPGSMQCPCRLGMTCSTRNTQGLKINGKPYGRCVYITTGPDEVDEDRLPPRLS